MLIRDLLRNTTKESRTLSEILADKFDSIDEQIVRILSEEYKKPKNDYRVLCGCFSVLWQASQKYARVGNKTVQKSYPLLNKGLQDKRISVKRLATLAVLNIICRIYFEREFSRNDDNYREIDAEIEELKKKI